MFYREDGLVFVKYAVVSIDCAFDDLTGSNKIQCGRALKKVDAGSCSVIGNFLDIPDFQEFFISWIKELCS